MAVCEQVFDQLAVGAQHASVVRRKAKGQQLLQRCVLRGVCLRLQDLLARRGILQQERKVALWIQVEIVVDSMVVSLAATLADVSSCVFVLTQRMSACTPS